MNILLESRAFYPSVGGLEMMSRGLATAWQDGGHTVRVVTITPLDRDAELDALTVERQPTSAGMRRHVRWADVFVQSGISLRSLHWPVWTGTPLVIIHHNLLSGGQDTGVRAWLKRRATHLGVNVAVSGPVAETVPGPVVRIPNTFRPVYDQPDAADESRDGLLFVGRLVSVKGADLAIEALRRLRERGVDTTLTICGDGPERGTLERQVRDADLQDAVTFEGWTDPDELADRYRRAEFLLVPSRYETFGIVALEALASGCPVVAAETGGLLEAVGACGLLVPPDDAEALADVTERALRSDVRNDLQSAMPAHVNRHRINRIATDYLHLLRRVVRVN
ncbi:glycosyltransferase family 4 protein [Salinibacter ruber]|uniref:glycosyltransferase family 4 protein n=1 Tax=Salinibacter ruber TaxID=146919 RepID=UPI002168E043|nr:glycosyltransferase involved in cell wall biosynthesis [Salinibacter ruber]